MRITEKEKVYLENKLGVSREESVIQTAFKTTNYNRLIGQMKGYNMLIKNPIDPDGRKVKSENPVTMEL